MGNIADALKKAGVGLIDQKDPLQEEYSPHHNTHVESRRDYESLHEREETAEHHHAASRAVMPQKRISKLWDERIGLVADGDSQATEAFRVLRSRILYPQDGKARPRTIMIASSAPEEGKSFVSINLAVAIARGLDQYSLLVDCDLRRPSLAHLLGMKGDGHRGLSEYLQERSGLSELIQRTAVEKLSVLPSGTPPANPAELLTSARMNRLVDELSDRYSDRFVIFDSAPFEVASEALVLSKKVDGVVLVVGYGKSDREHIRQMIESIGKEKVIGVVFNGLRESYIKQKMFYRYNGYDKYYGTASR